jgi:Lrp/AsnC family leucine-responsive transcriptional regulator
MDGIDLAILEALKQNGRASASEISRKVNLSVPRRRRTDKKADQAGIIMQYTVRLNRLKTGQKLLAFIFVNIDKNENIEGFRNAVVKQPCVLECHHVAGRTTIF